MVCYIMQVLVIYMGMGDMKTPDFDDLLAAFDIPDIDAKEAIQSDTDGNHNERSSGVGKERSGSPCLRPPESPESVPLAPHSDPPVVSVIVKNSVHSDDKTEEDVTGDFPGAESSHESPGPREDDLMPPDPFIYNGLKTVSDGATQPSTAPNLTQMQPNGPLWALSSSRVSNDDNQDGISSKHPASTFSPPQSLPLTDPPILSKHLISSNFPPRVDCEEAQPLNGNLRAGVRRRLSEDEESEPDLGSPALVIQESPDSRLCSAPKVPRLQRSPSSVFQLPSPSSPSLPVSNTQIEEPPKLLPSGVNPTSVTSKNDLPAKEKDIEHIIEERDSPESPEPEIPQPHTSLSTNQLGANEPEQKEGREEAPQDQVIDMSVSVQEKSGLHIKKDYNGAEETEGKSTEPSLVDSASEDVTNSSKTSAKPLKVRIKTVKTSAGNVTRTVSKVAPKGGASKGPGGSKVQAGARKAVHRVQKSGAASQGPPQVTMLPVSTLQDASTAMLFAASRAQNQIATTLSATAVNITRTSTLPTISSLGQKTMNGNPGIAKPASIVNNTGAVISRSQSSLVEAFNKILNSKNPLPSYQPDLSTMPPPEWGLRLPSTGYRCLECGDAFALERSLARHYDRRSMRIEVTCNHCSKRLAFFNKCSLLLHAREHKEKGLVMQCSHLVMSPVSVEQMIGQQDTVPIGLCLLSIYLYSRYTRKRKVLM